ncbi:hypothetical protein [Bradyrhizobium quebecense]|uniref:Uncharacterized protein n=2 Tax=Bradyrhizobium quebecense TaxID=2748629 RepID=A0ACD3VF08_9BRAD|nr:hypothetical protein [Bradyrhizobium quebecense]UGY05086.1 hypothetical protein J4P68_0010265 [Bradyrhizobium quebecense]
MKIIKNDPNLQLSEKMEAYKPSSSASQRQAQQDARTTVIDAFDKVPQFEGKGYGAVNVKGPTTQVHPTSDSNAISEQQTI